MSKNNNNRFTTLKNYANHVEFDDRCYLQESKKVFCFSIIVYYLIKN